jgi:hypothetical protein
LKFTSVDLLAGEISYNSKVRLKGTTANNMDKMSQGRFSRISVDDVQQVDSKDRLTVPLTYTMSNQSQQALETPRASPPTLLNIAQELRDIIFAHVFDTTDPNGIVDLRIVPCDSTREDVRAGTLSASEAPPPKHSLIACRQLYTEMKPAYTAAYRQYWNAQRFHITTTRPYILDKLRLASELDLRHIRCLVIAPRLRRTALQIAFLFEKTATWSVQVEPSPYLKLRPGDDLPWQLTDCSRRDEFLRNLEGLMGSLRKHYDVPTTIDPVIGTGLNSNEVYELSSLVWHLSWESNTE